MFKLGKVQAALQLLPPKRRGFHVCAIFISIVGSFCAFLGDSTPVEFPHGSVRKGFACNAGDTGLIPGSERHLEKGMATHSGILAWEIPWTEEPGGLQLWDRQELDTTE